MDWNFVGSGALGQLLTQCARRIFTDKGSGAEPEKNPFPRPQIDLGHGQPEITQQIPVLGLQAPPFRAAAPLSECVACLAQECADEGKATARDC